VPAVNKEMPLNSYYKMYHNIMLNLSIEKVSLKLSVIKVDLRYLDLSRRKNE